jgi:hypothetical protein
MNKVNKIKSEHIFSLSFTDTWNIFETSLMVHLSCTFYVFTRVVQFLISSWKLFSSLYFPLVTFPRPKFSRITIHWAIFSRLTFPSILLKTKSTVALENPKEILYREMQRGEMCFQGNMYSGNMSGNMSVEKCDTGNWNTGK